MNKHIEIGTFISKKDAAMLQAVAVMLMVWHHLFGFPERINVPYVLVLDRFFSIETYVSYFGRICIAVFAFISGYGMRKKVLRAKQKCGIFYNYRSVLLQILKFFSRYWIVFFIFIPIGHVIKIYPFDLRRFLNGIIGNGAGYNAEWWYVGTYLRLLLLFPILSWFADLIQKRMPFLAHILMALAVMVVLLLPRSASFYGFLSILLCFVQGMYFVDSNVFELLYRPLADRPFLRCAVGLMLCSIVFILRFYGVQDYLIVAAFVFAVVIILRPNRLMCFVQPVLLYAGKYSTYIWLTHTFFGYYYFQKLTFFPRYSWLVFLWCMLLSIATGIAMECILTWITKGLGKALASKK